LDILSIKEVDMSTKKRVVRIKWGERNGWAIFHPVYEDGKKGPEVRTTFTPDNTELKRELESAWIGKIKRVGGED